MKVALAQIKCVIGDVIANIQRINELSKEAATQGCEVVIFPEMSDVGYTTSAITENALSWDSKPFHQIRDIALKNCIFLICGISEKKENDIYNSIAVISPEGKLLDRYRKVHLFSHGPVVEGGFISPGSSLTLSTIGGITWGFTICYDLRFPELYRTLFLKGAEVLVSCSAWPAARAKTWDVLSKARAIENEAYFLGANRVGVDDGLEFCGRSYIIDPFGDVLSSGSADGEELVIGEIERDTVLSCRSSIPVFNDRRADVYGNLGV